MHRIVGPLALFICLIGPSRAQDTLKPFRTATPPVIDGMIDEAWSGAPHVTGFKTFIPDFGKLVAEQTDASMMYDDENLYFAFRCYDQPEKVKTSISSRDN